MLAAVVVTAFISGCLEQVSFVPRAPAEATLLVIRDGGNENDEINVFVDSLLVGKTFQNGVSVITVPAGNHYLIFEWKREYSGGYIDLAEKKVLGIRQFIMDAYIYKQFTNSAIADTEIASRLQNQNLSRHNFSYREAKEKMNTDDYLDCIKDIESPFELNGRGIKIRIKDE